MSQTNVLASAQRRKMKGYGDFKRIAAVIIPDDTTYKERCDKQSEKTVSDNALNEMKGKIAFDWFCHVSLLVISIVNGSVHKIYTPFVKDVINY